jgi:hypothetical protein
VTLSLYLRSSFFSFFLNFLFLSLLFSAGKYLFLVPFRDSYNPWNGERGSGMLARVDMNTFAQLKDITYLNLTLTNRSQIPSFPDEDLRGFSGGFACKSLCVRVCMFEFVCVFVCVRMRTCVHPYNVSITNTACFYLNPSVDFTRRGTTPSTFAIHSSMFERTQSISVLNFVLFFVYFTSLKTVSIISNLLLLSPPSTSYS